MDKSVPRLSAVAMRKAAETAQTITNGKKRAISPRTKYSTPATPTKRYRGRPRKFPKPRDTDESSEKDKSGSEIGGDYESGGSDKEYVDNSTQASGSEGIVGRSSGENYEGSEESSNEEDGESVTNFFNVRNGRRSRTMNTEDDSTGDVVQNRKLTPQSLVREAFISCGNKAAQELFHWLLHPADPDTFFKDTWDRYPLYIPRTNVNYYRGLFSSKDFDKIVKENDLKCNGELDILSYVHGKRIPVKCDTKVYSGFAWDSYHNGNSIRMRNPQAYHKGLWKLCSLLQEFFSSSVGANMYLTPPNSQGFPPHYDDIDAFILQLEGKKKWLLYEPREENETLPRYSSGDLDKDEIGSPCMELELSAGDLLYFPRGYIHQARTTGEHSLHITISTNQLNTWGDLVQAGMSHAVDVAMQHNVDFRKSLPRDYFDYVGSTYTDSNSVKRHDFLGKVYALAHQAMQYYCADFAADVHALEFIHSSMPPSFNKIEAARSIHGNGTRMEGGKISETEKITLQTKVRFIRKRAFRLVVDEEGSRLYHTLENSKNNKEQDACFTDVDPDLVPAVNVLFSQHPRYIKVGDLPIDDEEIKLDFAQQMYDMGFLMTESPLELIESAQ